MTIHQQEVGQVPHEQRMEALRLGNAVRIAKADLRKDVAAGRTSVLAVLADPPDYIAKVPLVDVIAWTPSIGESKAHKLLRSALIDQPLYHGGMHSLPVGRLTARHLAAVQDTMGEYLSTRRHLELAVAA